MQIHSRKINNIEYNGRSFMNNFFKIILLLPFVVISLYAMEPELSQTKTTIEQLPDELKLHIASFLVSADTIEQACENIRSFFSSNKSFAYFLNDTQINSDLIKELAQRYFDIPIMPAAV